MRQNENIEYIKKELKKRFSDKIRFIKIHGGKYQEAGLPDIMGVIEWVYCDRNIWIEVKRDWQDEPSALQKYNITDLRKRNFFTGFVAGKEFKLDWQDPEPVPFEYAVNELIT